MKCECDFKLDLWRKCPICAEPVPDEILATASPAKGPSSMCPNCFRFLSADGFCSQCRAVTGQPSKVTNQPNEAHESQPTRSKWSDIGQDVSGDRALVQAQNRTTHAVRSLAVFFFVSITISIPGLFLVLNGARNLSTCEYGCEYPLGMLNFGYGVIGFRFLLALITGLMELGKSKP